MTEESAPAKVRLIDQLGMLPEQSIRDAANGLNGVQPMLGQWQRDLRLARAVEAMARAAERERCIATLRALKDKSGVNDTGTMWLQRLTRGDCVQALVDLWPNVRANLPP